MSDPSDPKRTTREVAEGIAREFLHDPDDRGHETERDLAAAIEAALVEARTGTTCFGCHDYESHEAAMAMAHAAGLAEGEVEAAHGARTMNTPAPGLKAMAEEVLGRHYEHEDYALCDCGENWPCDASRLASAALGVVGERDAAIKRADVGWAEVAACHRQLGDYVEAVALAEEKLEASQAREKALREALEHIKQFSSEGGIVRRATEALTATGEATA